MKRHGAVLLPFEGMPAESLDPPVKWAGGKRWQVPRIRPLWMPHAHRRLVEPCCGALGMALGLRPERALLNDINPHLTNFLRCVQQGLSLELPMANDKALFLHYRNRYNALDVVDGALNVEAAGLFYYLNKTTYNGLYRVNGRGAFNAPFGKYPAINYRRDFSAYVPVLTPWTFTTGDFEDVPLEADDFIYCDPPYDTPFTDYVAGGFSREDQVRLVRWLRAHPGPVVLVNQATPFIKELYRRAGFDLTYVDAPRKISCTGNRAAAHEVIATRLL